MLKSKKTDIHAVKPSSKILLGCLLQKNELLPLLLEAPTDEQTKKHWRLHQQAETGKGTSKKKQHYQLSRFSAVPLKNEQDAR